MASDEEAKRKQIFQDLRRHLRRSATDNMQAINFLEDYKYPEMLANMETSAEHMLAGIKQAKKLID